MITETRYAYPPSVIDHSSNAPAEGLCGEASPFARAMDLARQEQPVSGAGPMNEADAAEDGGITRITDFDDVMNWTVQPAEDLGDFVTAMPQEEADSFMATAQSDEGPPAPNEGGLGETVLSPEILNALDPFSGHEGQKYNFRLKQWVDA